MALLGRTETPGKMIHQNLNPNAALKSATVLQIFRLLQYRLIGISGTLCRISGLCANVSCTQIAEPQAIDPRFAICLNNLWKNSSLCSFLRNTKRNNLSYH